MTPTTDPVVAVKTRRNAIIVTCVLIVVYAPIAYFIATNTA